jgi:hypothetical protein
MAQEVVHLLSAIHPRPDEHRRHHATGLAIGQSNVQSMHARGLARLQNPPAILSASGALAAFVRCVQFQVGYPHVIGKSRSARWIIF